MNHRDTLKKNNSITYQVAAILIIAAALGITFLYFYQRNNLGEKQADKGVEEEAERVSEATESVETTDPAYEIAEETDTGSEIQTTVSAEVLEEIAEASTLALHFSEEIAWPIEGNVLMDYSMDQTVYFETLQQYRYNPALIIAGEVNQQVISGCDGKVVSILNNAKTGTTVTVDIGDGYQAVYGQLKEIPVATGSYVSKGQCIGYLSEPSKYYTKEGANLYFQILKDGEPVNPQDYLEQ
jgi:septal ring factor EnvC (AmiA/AmiB activator)